MEILLYGRRLLISEIERLGIPANFLTRFMRQPAMAILKETVICQRCHSSFKKSWVQLPQGQYYCPNCIQLGRVTSDAYLYYLPEPNDFQIPNQPLTWTGQLTPAQFRVSEALRRSFQKRRTHLLFAVTGAGKTEMLFPVLQDAIIQGCRIGIATPRIDVCNELYPWVQQAFATTSMQLCHGGVTVPYGYKQLNIVTTHQLLRFYHAFDLLIIDEVDAFPYVNDPVLHYAATQAKKTVSSVIYLTATPTADLRGQVRQKTLPISYLPKRFHGRPLPIPKLIYQPQLHQKIDQILSKKFKFLLKQSFIEKRQILCFVAKISLLAPLADLIKQEFSRKLATVHAKDDQRQQKVMDFRKGKIQLLLTTTILERGVTFSNLDVYVLEADDQVFSAAALVQIAGRAGRNAQFSNGNVYFFYEYYNRAIQASVRQIKLMNQKAGFK